MPRSMQQNLDASALTAWAGCGTTVVLYADTDHDINGHRHCASDNNADGGAHSTMTRT